MIDTLIYLTLKIYPHKLDKRNYMYKQKEDNTFDLLVLQGSPRSRLAGKALDFTDTLDGDDEGLGDTIQDTMNTSDAAQLREDAKFHEMSRYVIYASGMCCQHVACSQTSCFPA